MVGRGGRLGGTLSGELPQRIEPAAFWRWAYSDFLSNALRGVLAEFIVAQALGGDSRPRTEWDAYDLITEDGLKIEVKSSAYLQSWPQQRPSTIRFDIGLKRGWEAATNLYAQEAGRAADVYVFCIFAEGRREHADPLELSQWFFLVCPTAWLNAHFPAQKTVALSTLESTGLKRLEFGGLRGAIEKAAAPPVGKQPPDTGSG